jgi:hypothetical protein
MSTFWASTTTDSSSTLLVWFGQLTLQVLPSGISDTTLMDQRAEKQQSSTKGNHVFPDNIFTAICLDGSIIEPHAFAHNPDLMSGSQVKVDLCKTYDVAPGMFIYSPDPGNWVGESSSVACTVVKNYSCYVVHDDGRSWKPEKVDIFAEYEAARVSVMPPIPQGEISPNDCMKHSIGKEAECASRPDDASDAKNRHSHTFTWETYLLTPFAAFETATSCWKGRSPLWQGMWTC